MQITMQKRSPRIRSVAAGVLCGLALSGGLATWSEAAFGSACGLISTTALAKDFKLAHAVIRPLLTLAPKFGGVESTCLFNAWSGGEPASSKQVALKLSKGKLATLSITTWAPGSGLLVPGSHPFEETLAAARHEAQARLITALHGKTFAPSALGAEAEGDRAVNGHAREVEAIWWNSTMSQRILALSIREGKTTPILAPLEKIAASVVPAFGL